MEPTAPRVPWWFFIVFGLVVTAVLGLLLISAVGWIVQIGAVTLLVLVLLAVIRRGRP